MNTDGKSAIEIASLVRPNIRALEPYHSAREKVLEGILLDANENPFLHEWDGVSLNRYPDPFQRTLRQLAANVWGVKQDQLAAGVGSDEVLEWIFKVFCQPGLDSVVTAEPTYGMYQVTAQIFGVQWQPCRLDASFQFNAQAFLSWVSASAKVLFLCSPNNPTGNLLDREQVRMVCREWPKIVVVDEAYIDFAEDGSMLEYLEDHPNLIILRTLSKAYGRAALRLGFAISSPEIISFFLKVKTPYNVGALTMRLGCAALSDQAEKLENVARLRSERERVTERLRAIPAVERVYPSDANFILMRCRGARQIVEGLFEKGIVVRDRSSVPGLPDCIRLSIGTREENDLFLQELEQLLGEKQR